jgi:threonine/homoserine/homoserine lactone efflux protein
VTLLVGPLLFVLLGVGAVKGRRAGLSGWETSLMVAVGSLCILVLMFGILMFGFRNFG